MVESAEERRRVWELVAGVHGEGVPRRPTCAEIGEAWEVCRGFVDAFPYAAERDGLGIMALLLTPLLRPIIAGPVPMCVITSEENGSGKSTLAGMAQEVAEAGAVSVERSGAGAHVGDLDVPGAAHPGDRDRGAPDLLDRLRDEPGGLAGPAAEELRDHVGRADQWVGRRRRVPVRG